MMKKGDKVLFKWNDTEPESWVKLDGKEGVIIRYRNGCSVVNINGFEALFNNSSLTPIELASIPDLTTVTLDDLLAEIKRRAEK